MKKHNLEQHESEIRNASKRGAIEDIIHVSSVDEGYDLRVSNRFGKGEKQEIDKNGNG